jgi:hypothetical protein
MPSGNTKAQLAKDFALDIPAGYGSQGSQEPEDRMAAAYAPRSQLTSSKETASRRLSPIRPQWLSRNRTAEALTRRAPSHGKAYRSRGPDFRQERGSNPPPSAKYFAGLHSSSSGSSPSAGYNNECNDANRRRQTMDTGATRARERMDAGATRARERMDAGATRARERMDAGAA